MRDYYGKQGIPEPELPACPIVKRLSGQRALVTGANSGIGRAIAIALGHAGADVVVNYVEGPAPLRAGGRLTRAQG